MQPYFLLLAFVVAWARIERRHGGTSHGVLSAIVGVLLLQIGWHIIGPLDKPLAFAVEAVGLLIAMVGVTRIVGE